MIHRPWNPLEIAIRSMLLDPKKTMNQLQLAGIVSDNAVNPRDVCKADCKIAVDRIERRHLAFLLSH